MLQSHIHKLQPARVGKLHFGIRFSLATSFLCKTYVVCAPRINRCGHSSLPGYRFPHVISKVQLLPVTPGLKANTLVGCPLAANSFVPSSFVSAAVSATYQPKDILSPWTQPARTLAEEASRITRETQGLRSAACEGRTLSMHSPHLVFSIGGDSDRAGASFRGIV